jgi:hypothetical protein
MVHPPIITLSSLLLHNTPLDLQTLYHYITNDFEGNKIISEKFDQYAMNEKIS